MLMRIDYDKVINKYIVDEKMYMFTKLVFSKNIYVAIFEYLIEKIIISGPPDYIYHVHMVGGGGWGGMGWGGRFGVGWGEGGGVISGCGACVYMHAYAYVPYSM